MEINQIIAENLKKLRTDRNLSLGQLAAICEVSKVMLSQIERGETNPTINTLWKIANGLRVPYTALLEQQAQDTVVLHKAELGCQSGDEGHYRVYCYYPSNPHRNFELFQLELDAGCHYTSIGHSEKSQEYILVLAGQLRLEINRQTYQLAANDAVSFAAAGHHSYTAEGDQLVRAVIINYYPA